MVGTITPLVQRAKKRKSVSTVVAIAAVFVASSLAGGVVIGVLGRLIRGSILALTPSLVRSATHDEALLVGVLAAYVLVGRATGRFWLPMFDRQVPLSWRQKGGAERALIPYSFFLGMGIVTRINSPAIYLLPVAAILASNWQLGLLPICTYALFRAGVAAAASVAMSDWYRHDAGAVLDLLRDQRLFATAAQGVVLAAITAGGIMSVA